MNVENFGALAATIGAGFFAGALIGFALKKVLKILAIVVGLFFAGLAYLQYQQILNINWDKLQTKSQGAITTLANATSQISNNIGYWYIPSYTYVRNKFRNSINRKYGNGICGRIHERLVRMLM